MMDIARKEGMKIEDNAMDTLIESVGNDIRQVLNALQMISRSKSKVSIRYSDMKERIKTISKDSILRMTPFTGVQEVFNGKKPFNRRYESFFVDYSLIPLMVRGVRARSARISLFSFTYSEDSLVSLAQPISLSLVTLLYPSLATIPFECYGNT